MALGALIGGGAALVGGLLSSRSSSKAAKRSADAQIKAAQLQSDASRYAADVGLQGAQEAAAAQREAASIAAEAARFRPYSITTGFGTSSFDTNKDTGTYTLDPRIAAFRDQYYSGAQNALNQMQGYDPQAMAQTVYGEQMGLLNPSRQAEDEALRAAQLRSGRIGLGLTGSAVGAGTGGMLNPQQFSLDRARALADAQLAAQSRDYGQAELDRLIGRGQGLLTYGTGLEELGMKSLTMGLDAGSRAGVSGANQAQALLSGGMNAAQSMLSGTQAQMAGITDSANILAKGQYGATNTRINADLAREQAWINVLTKGAGMFGSAFSGSPATAGSPVGNASYAPGSANAAFASFY